MQKFIAAYQNKTAENSARLNEQLSSPEFRDELYKYIPTNPEPSYRELILELFEQEMTFREQLWEEEVEDPNDLFENIYLCAFLIYQMGFAEDVYILWEAKYLNMDVGSELGAQYFVGAGLEETLRLLETSTDEEAADISTYIQSWFQSDRDVEALKAWETGRTEYFGRNAGG